MVDDKHQLGVLFVHGIGEQREGQTLTSFATALYTWLFHWTSQRAGQRLRLPQLRDVDLSPSSSGRSEEPARGSLRVALQLADGTAYDRRWLLAESWWAEVFRPPRFADLAHWVWKVSTCLFVLQFVIPMRRRWRLARGKVPRPSTDHRAGGVDRSAGTTASQSTKLDRARLVHGTWALVYFVLMSVAAVLSVPLSLLLFVLVLASLLPVPRIERAVQWVMVHLSAVLGDSYVLVRCPVEYAAMRTRVAADLAWLEKHCDKVVIVAHSQGAAIAHQVLADEHPSPDKVRAFVTVGQGIGKLHMLDRLNWDDSAASQAARSRLLVSTGLVLTSLPWLVAILGRWAPWDGAPSGAIVRLILYGFGLLLIALGVHAAIRAAGENVEEDVHLLAAGRDYIWIDYYASADPVSNGSLERSIAADDSAGGAPGTGGGRQPCHRVYNQASILSDHTSYLRNRIQFLTGLMADLVAVDRACKDGARVVDEQGLAAVGRLAWRSVLQAAERTRYRLVWSLVALRIVALAIGALVWSRDAGGLLRGPVDQMTTSLPGAVPEATDPVLRVGAAILAMVGVYALLFLPLWRAAERLTTDRFFRSQAPKDPMKGAGTRSRTLSGTVHDAPADRTPQTVNSR